MSSIKDLLQEENDAEKSLKNAEREAERIVLEARNKAKELVKKAQGDDTLVNELTRDYEERVSESKSKIQAESRSKMASQEALYRKNLQSAIDLIFNEALGVEPS